MVWTGGYGGYGGYAGRLYSVVPYSTDERSRKNSTQFKYSVRHSTDHCLDRNRDTLHTIMREGMMDLKTLKYRIMCLVPISTDNRKHEHLIQTTGKACQACQRSSPRGACTRYVGLFSDSAAVKEDENDWELIIGIIS